MQTLQFGTQSRNIMFKSVVNRSYEKCEKTISFEKRAKKSKKKKGKKVEKHYGTTSPCRLAYKKKSQKDNLRKVQLSTRA